MLFILIVIDTTKISHVLFLCCCYVYFLEMILFFAESEFFTVHHHETVNFVTVHYRSNK